MSHFEAIAVIWRALTGYVPYGIFHSLYPEEQRRLENMTSTQASKLLSPPLPLKETP